MLPRAIGRLPGTLLQASESLRKASKNKISQNFAILASPRLSGRRKWRCGSWKTMNKNIRKLMIFNNFSISLKVASQKHSRLHKDSKMVPGSFKMHPFWVQDASKCVKNAPQGPRKTTWDLSGSSKNDSWRPVEHCRVPQGPFWWHFASFWSLSGFVLEILRSFCNHFGKPSGTPRGTKLGGM